MTDIRSLALEILLEYSGSKAFLSEILKKTQDKYSYLEERDRAFIKNLVTGTAEKRIALDHVINSVSKVKTDKMKPVIYHIISMAAYEILYMDHVPARASVNEAVRLTKKKHIGGLAGFVNAVTRKIAAMQEKGEITFPDAKTEYSCPDLVYDLLCERFGEKRAEDIIRASDSVPGQYIRINTSLTDKERVSAELKKEGATIEDTAFSDNALKVKGLIPAESPSFVKGYFSMQDAGSIAAIDAADIKPGMAVIDMCASPGGKACYAAELMKGSGEVRAFDISDEKKIRIDENIKRLGLKNIRSDVKDARQMDPLLKGSADLVIADLPCSGLGVMGRKVDIRYRIGREDIDSLCSLQREILENAASYVRKGGKLLFSTCTLTRQETEDQRDHIKERFGFELLKEKQFIQGVDDCDGFYYALFIGRDR